MGDQVTDTKLRNVVTEHLEAGHRLEQDQYGIQTSSVPIDPFYVAKVIAFVADENNPTFVCLTCRVSSLVDDRDMEQL